MPSSWVTPWRKLKDCCARSAATTKRKLRTLDPLAYPATLALIPAFKALDRDAAFDASVDAFIDGVSFRSKSRTARQRSRS
jgi:hypothetical protein